MNQEIPVRLYWQYVVKLSTKCRVVSLTGCISHMLCVPKSNSHSNAEDHEQPIDLRDIYLAMNFLRCVHNFYPREAT